MLVTIRTSRVKTLLGVCTHTQSAPVESARKYQTDCIREHLPEKKLAQFLNFQSMSILAIHCNRKQFQYVN